jgi:hypothetical protein
MNSGYGRIYPFHEEHYFEIAQTGSRFSICGAAGADKTFSLTEEPTNIENVCDHCAAELWRRMHRV